MPHVSPTPPAGVAPDVSPSAACGAPQAQTHRPGRGRFQQANKEAVLTLGLYGTYFVWWYAFAYGLGSGDPSTYSYVFGFPAWFFYSCIAGYPVLTLALWLMVRYCFKDMPLDDHTLHPASPDQQTAELSDLLATEPPASPSQVDRTSGPVI